MVAKSLGHVQVSFTVAGRRTTFTVERLLVQLMGIRLGKQPDTLESTLAVRDWLEQRLTELPRPTDDGTRPGYARWARYYLITEVADPELLKQWRRLTS